MCRSVSRGKLQDDVFSFFICSIVMLIAIWRAGGIDALYALGSLNTRSQMRRIAGFGGLEQVCGCCRKALWLVLLVA
jgi:hypothetical protein